MKKKTILILGSTGMAGHMIYYYLEQTNQYNIINFSYRKSLTENSILVDIKDSKRLEMLIVNVNPDYIINCIGILIKGSHDVENAIYVNSYFPHLLVKIANSINSKVIHLSTDCVFSGDKGFYNENSFRDADDIYGRSKALGELDEDSTHITIRTSIIGPELKSNGEGLLHWVLMQTGEITGYENAIWSGVTTLELAKFVDYFLKNEPANGIIHLTNGDAISKYELLKLIIEIGNLHHINVIKGSSLKSVNKSLNKSDKFNYEVPTYREMVVDLFEWMQFQKTLYRNYNI